MRPGLPFLKGHGTGNDFVVLPDRDAQVELTPQLVRQLCDRRFGIGADGVLRVVPLERMSTAEDAAGQSGARWFMDYHNADGSLAEMCGNGVRVYARFLVEAGWEPAGTILLATRGGLKRVEVPEQGDVTVAMGPPELQPEPGKVAIGGRVFEGQRVSMGNPHLVVRLDSVAEVAGLDLTVEPDVSAEMFPTGVNVEFYAPAPSGSPGSAPAASPSPSTATPFVLEMRVHERGVGETLSCGTGACAVAVAAGGRPGPPMEIRVPGGRLQVQWTPDTVLLRGPAELVAEGHWLGGNR